MERVDKKSRNFVGIDLHKNRFTVHYIATEDRWTMTYELSQMDEFMETINLDDCVGVEASCNTFSFVDILKKKCSDVTVFNPHKLKLISQVQKKTDKVDAEKIAQFVKISKLGGEEMIDPVCVPDQKIRDLRSLFATYKNLKRQIIMCKNRIHALLTQNMVLIKNSDIDSLIGRKRILTKVKKLPLLNAQLDIMFEQLQSTETIQVKIENLILLNGKDYRNVVEILTSITGVSVFTGMAIIADVGDIKRFPNPKKLATYLRSAPGIDSSNNVTIIKRTNKFGRRLSIELLIQATNHFCAGNERLKSWFNNKKSTRGAGRARMALCRKIITQIWHMWTNMESNRYKNEKLHKNKMDKYDKFIAESKAAA